MHRLRWTYLWVLPVFFIITGHILFAMQTDLAEIDKVRAFLDGLVQTVARWSSFLHFSLTEVFVVVTVPILFILFFILVFKVLFYCQNRKRMIMSWLKRLTVSVIFMYMFFMLMHGYNYFRLPISDHMGFLVQNVEIDALEYTLGVLIPHTNVLREQVKEDETGVFQMRRSTRMMLNDAYKGFERIGPKVPILSGAPIRPKAVRLSAYWSYTGIGGMYFPFFAEANVNSHMPHAPILLTALHEIAHVRGFAREDEANFIAFLTGIHHPDRDFVYAAMLHATAWCLDALEQHTENEDVDKIMGLKSDAVRRDLEAHTAYWQSFDGPIRNAARRANDLFLKANQQQDGIKSYGRAVDLIVSWLAHHEQQYGQEAFVHIISYAS